MDGSLPETQLFEVKTFELMTNIFSVRVVGEDYFMNTSKTKHFFFSLRVYLAMKELAFIDGQENN